MRAFIYKEYKALKVDVIILILVSFHNGVQ